MKQACTIPEIVAILAHELGHWALSHLIKGLVVTMLHLMLFFTLYGEMVSSAAMFRSFGSLLLFQPNRPSVQNQLAARHPPVTRLTHVPP